MLTAGVISNRAKYDECAKKLLTYKAIIAWILKSCTKEFSQYSVKFICDKCLKDDVEISEHAVHQDQTVYYDIRFKAYLPGNPEPIQLIINLEIQLNDTPGYPLVTRGFYYCARMISEQYGTVFTDGHYEKIQEEKKKRLHEDFDIAMTEEFESEVRDMCNLSRALVEQGVEQGVEKEKMSLAQMMIEEKEPVEKILKYTGFAVDKLKEIAAAMGRTLV